MKRPLILYLSSEVFLSLGIGMVIFTQPFFYKSAGLSGATIGLLFAINSTASGISALILGPLADWIGASRVFKLATLLIGLNYIFMVSAHSLSLWVMSSAISGLAAAMLLTTENVVLSSLTIGQEKAGVLSKFVSMYTFVMGVGVIAAGFISSWSSYRMAIWVGAGLTLVAPAIRVFVQAPDARANRLFRLPSKRLSAMGVYALCFGVALGLFNPFATLILHGSFHLDDRVTSVLSAASNFMMALGAFVVSWLIRRMNYDRTLLLSFLCGALFTLCMAWTGNVYLFASLYLFRTIMSGVPGSIVDATFLDTTDQTEYAQMFGVRVFGNSLGVAIGSFVGGILLNRNFVSWMMLLSAIVLMLAYVYLAFLIRWLRRWHTHVTLDEAIGTVEA
jgi:MFS family permease